MVDRQLTLMAVHAHPDDEATFTGGILAKYAAEGIRTVLVTCTDGGCGDGPGGAKPGTSGHDPAAVAALRRTELEESCRVLGVSELELMGYADSGMMGWPQNDAPGSFWTVPVEQAAARLGELMRLHRPDVVVTYDPFGFYGHPDHIQAHRITTAAIEQTGTAAKVYWTTVPRQVMTELARMTGEDDGAGLGAADADITSRIDVADHCDRMYQALATHESQAANIPLLKLGLDRYTRLAGVEAYVRVENGRGTALPENDLFAGLR